MGIGIRTTIEANAMLAMNTILRKLMVRVIQAAILLTALMQGCSCDRKPPPTWSSHDAMSVIMNASWSPDGEQIAICYSGSESPRKRGIYLVDTATWGTTELFVTNDFSTFATVNWSPDGEWLLFSYRAQLYKLKADGDSLTQLTFTSRQFHSDWAESDTLIVYNISIGDSGGVWVMKTDGSQKKSVIRYGSSPSFGAGDSILYIEYTDSPSKRAHLAILNIPDSTHRSVHNFTVDQPYSLYRYPQYSGARQELVWSIDWNIWKIDMDGRNLRRLTSTGGDNPNWSPDGQKIIYTKPTLEGGSLWIMNADGSGKMPVPGW